MRNLKKLLSMLLVVAMIVSLCAVGSFSAAAAEYSETTNYKEAAAVVSGIGVINGYEDGTMQYDKAVTREEAAKIICVALVGDKAVANLKTAAAPFDDVAANRWSAPYIAYLKSLGIVNGKTATEFDPTAEVTGVEFAKMLLCAVGYGKANEFVGASWDVNTITAANTNGIFENTKALDLTAAATREECMLYAFNTIVGVPVVKYNATFASYYTGNSVMSGTAILDKTEIGDVTIPAYLYTLAYANFKLSSTTTSTDAYGRPAKTWKTDSKIVAESVATVLPDATFVGNVSGSAIFANLPSDVVKDLNKEIKANIVMDPVFGPVAPLGKTDSDVVEYYVDGVQKNFNFTEIESNGFFSNMLATAGSVTEAYVLDYDQTAGVDSKGSNVVRFVVTNQYVGKVTAVSASANTASVTFLDNNASVTVSGTTVDITGLAKKDYVLMTVIDGATRTVTSIKKIGEPIVGTYTSFNSMSQYVFNTNDKYSASTMADKGTGSTGLGAMKQGNQYKFYLDDQGNILFAELYSDNSAVDMSKYAFSKKVNGNIDETGDYGFKVQAVYTDGSVEWVPYDVNPVNGAFKFNGATYYVGFDTKVYTTAANRDAGTSPAFSLSALNNSFFTYTANDGKVNFKNLDSKYAYVATAVKLDANTGAVVNIDGKNYSSNSKTVATVVDGAGNAFTYNGEAKFDGVNYNEAGTQVLVTYAYGSTTINSIFVYQTDELTTTSYAYVVGASYIDGNYGYVNLFLDGQYVADAKVSTEDYAMVATFGTAGYHGGSIVYQVDVTNGLYDLTFVPGIKNNGTAFGSAIGANVGYYNINHFAYDYWYAWATIDDVDVHAFTTLTAEVGTEQAGSEAADVASIKYYYDANTVIYDCTAGGVVASALSEGQHFIAVTDTHATYGANYCAYIWIIG